jgi:hypothetical protein
MKTMVRCRRWVRPRERTIKSSPYSPLNTTNNVVGESAGVRCKVCGMVLPMDTDEVEAHLENGCSGGGGGGGSGAISSISSNNVINENRISRNPFQSGFNRLMGSFREKNNQVDHGDSDNSGAAATAASVVGSDSKETAKLQKQVQVDDVEAEKSKDVASMDIASLLLAEHAKAEKLLEQMALQRHIDNDDDDDADVERKST